MKYTPFILVIILSLTFVVYSDSFSVPFQFDDHHVILESQQIQELTSYVDLGLWFDIQNRTFSKFTLALNYAAGGTQVFGYHLINFFLHIAFGLLAFFFSRKLLMILVPQIKFPELYATVVTLVVLLHPIQTQAVSYIVQRMTLMAAVFYFSACFLYLEARLCDGAHKRPLQITLYFSFLVCVYLGLMSKQNVASIFFLLIAFEVLLIPSISKSINYKWVGFWIAFLCVSVVVILTWFAIPTIDSPEIDRIGYLLTQNKVLLRYIGLLFLPIVQNLDYDIEVSTSLFSIPEILGFTLLLVMCVLIFIFRKSRPITSFAILFFLISLSVESTLIPIRDVIMEHRLYLPMFGFGLMIAGTLARYVSYENKKLVLGLIVLTFTGFYATRTYARNKVWASEISLWSDTLKKSPGKVRPYINLAHSFRKIGDLEAAKKHLLRSIPIEGTVDAYISLTGIYLELGIYDSVDLYLDKASQIRPNDVDVLNNRGIYYLKTNQILNAIPLLRRASRKGDCKNDSWFNLGQAYYFNKNYRASEIVYLKAMACNRNVAAIRYNLGRTYIKQSRYDDAIAAFKTSIEDGENMPKVWNNLGLAYFLRGDTTLAITSFQKTLDLEPSNENAIFNLKFLIE